MIDYSGDNITIEEMPQGCIINSVGGEVVVHSVKDALALIESLTRLVSSMVE